VTREFRSSCADYFFFRRRFTNPGRRSRHTVGHIWAGPTPCPLTLQMIPVGGARSWSPMSSAHRASSRFSPAAQDGSCRALLFAFLTGLQNGALSRSAKGKSHTLGCGGGGGGGWGRSERNCHLRARPTSIAGIQPL